MTTKRKQLEALDDVRLEELANERHVYPGSDREETISRILAAPAYTPQNEDDAVERPGVSISTGPSDAASA